MRRYARTMEKPRLGETVEESEKVLNRRCRAKGAEGNLSRNKEGSRRKVSENAKLDDGL